jgi:hypothetical protein
MLSDLETNGCFLIKNFVDPHTINIISKYMENKIRREEWLPTLNQLKDGTQVTSEYEYYADPLIEVLLDKYLPEIEALCNKELLPTYSYTRIYMEKDTLTKHFDRDPCEYSVTISVASVGEMSCINTGYKGIESAHELAPGDALFYKGCEVEHWRDTLQPGQMVVQFMLHYVDKNGPWASFKYDRREMLGCKKV